MNHLNAVTLIIVLASFLFVTLIGFASARWRPAEDLMHLNEWGLAGRGFGTFVSWFLLGGDIYTAYTFIAVPALVYATGAAGFYALAYTIMVFPIVFIFAPRLWSVARARGYVTPGEFVRGRHGSQGLGLAVAATGILATMPYIALQLVGIESVLTVMGIGSTSGNAFIRDLPLIIAFGVVAAYTYLAGLRAPALIAFVKDILIYVTVIVAMLYIPSRLGGWGHIFGTASAHLQKVNPATGKPFGSIVVMPAGEWAYATLALGSALALFVYPHATTGVFAAKRRAVIRRNAAMLPAYSLVLGLIALFGYMARSVPAVNADVKASGGNAQLSVPLLFAHMFPSWFAGIADSAIVIGALVPAAIMSIAAANLFTRTIYKELFRPYATPAEETRVARLASLLMKVGALGFALELNKTFSINLQLLGGIWILQTFPAIVIGLYTRWFHRIALIIGWAAGMAYGTVQAYQTAGGGQAHFGASVAPVFGHTTYIAVTALIINLVVAAVLTLVFRKIGLQDGYDETRPSDYLADPVTVPVAPSPSKTEPPPASGRPSEGPPASWSPPEPPPAVVFEPPPAPNLNAATVPPAFSAPPTSPTPLFTAATWTVLVAADRGYYDRMKMVCGWSGSDVAFPAHASERRIPLVGKQMRIGRRNAARELEPEIDLADPPVDLGISRLHAMLIAAPDGTWSVLDQGSANGTLLNGRQIATGDRITLREGDRINLGAWTVITVHCG
jgi:solute:Na+ symporter, SSS family